MGTRAHAGAAAFVENQSIQRSTGTSRFAVGQDSHQGHSNGMGGGGDWQEGVAPKMGKAQSYPARWGLQMAALMYKNGLLALRNWRAFLLRLATPPVFVFLVWVINRLVVSGLNRYNQFDTILDPEAQYIDPIPACADSPFMRDPCWDFAYTPSDSSLVQEIVSRIRSNNPGYAIPEEKVVGLRDRAEANSWLMTHPMQSPGVYHFDVSDPKHIGFTLQTNSTNQYFRSDFQNPTTYIQLPMQNAAEREIARSYFEQQGKSLSGWSVALKLFAHPPYDRFDIVAEAAAPFIFAANMFGFVTLLSLLVLEKELGLRQALRTMGMMDSAYWLSWMTYETVVGFAVSLLISIAGVICGFPLFRNNSFVLYWALFLTFALAMTSFSMFLAVFVRRSSSAVYLGFAVFIVGWITQVAVVFGYPYTPDNYKSVVPLTVVFSVMPWSLLAKGMADLGKAVEDPRSPGLGVGDAFSYCQNGKQAVTVETASGLQYEKYVDYDCVLSLGQCITLLLALWVGYFLAAIYLDNVLPNERGVRRPLYYFLLPQYWGVKGRKTTTKRNNLKHRIINTTRGQQVLRLPVPLPEEQQALEVDPDVQEEERVMRGLLEGLEQGSPESQRQLSKYAVGMFELQRVFKQFQWCGLRKRPDFWAVKGAWLGLEKGQLLCILGPNGAGKTTTFNLLTGVIPASGGDALVYGEPLSAPGGIDAIRGMMGVCPQFDVLWDELTGREHMMIYGLIKGLGKRQSAEQATELLSSVKLTEAASQASGTYSGGMKRRLSVAIALLGDPKVVYLDEPTTGMDPISRRHVWDIIESAKAGRAIVLTTHSMEEADILGDRIGIMARGRLRAIGTSIRLKQRFGSGYQISVGLKEEAQANGGEDGGGAASVAHGGGVGSRGRASFDAVERFFMSRLGVAPSDFTGAYMTFRVGGQHEGELPQLLADLESRSEEMGVSDIQLSLTSLEEVFLNIAKQAEIEAARAGGQSTRDVLLDDGTRLKVPVGEELATDQASGRQYKIVWVQDDAGMLQVLSHAAVEGSSPPGSSSPGAPSMRP